MTSRMRHKQGADNPVNCPVDTGTVIEIGDMLYLATDDARPASAQAAATVLATRQESFHDNFLGISEQASRSGDTDDVRVATSGRHEMDCAAATFELGALVGPADAGSNLLEDQKVVAVATPNLAIGRVAKRYGSNTTKVLVEIISTVMYGGPQVMA